MRSLSVVEGENILAQNITNIRADARGASFLLVQQMLGSFDLSTNPANGKTLTLTINGTAVVCTFVSAIGTAAGNVLIGASAAATVANLLALLNQPQTTTATGVALSAANQALASYVSCFASAGGTTLYVTSSNTNLYAPLTSFSASTNATSDSWTGNTMALYVHKGVVYVGGTRVIFAGGVTPTVTAPTSHPRIDVLAIDNTGTLAWTAGTENASPVAPTYPANKVALCELYNVVSETALYDFDNQQSGEGYIYNDVRPTLGSSVNLLAVTSNILADADATRDLGSSGDRWNNLYAVTLHGDGSNVTNLNTPFTGLNSTPVSEAVADRAALAASFYQSDGGIKYDTKGIWNGTSTSFSQSLTVGSNANRVLIVMVASANSGFATPSSMQYNGVAMTQIATANDSGAGATVTTFYLVAPATGAHNLTFSISSATDYRVAAYSYYNAAQTSAVIADHKESCPSTSTASITLTTAADALLVVGIASNEGTTNGTGSGNVDTNNTQATTGANGSALSGDSGVLNGGVVATLTYTSAPNSHTELALVAIAPFTAAVLAVQNASSAANNQRMKAFIGFAVGAQATPGSNTIIASAGILNGFSGLITGSQYYLNDTNGTIGTSTGSNTRKVGIAMSPTMLAITNVW